MVPWLLWLTCCACAVWSALFHTKHWFCRKLQLGDANCEEQHAAACSPLMECCPAAACNSEWHAAHASCKRARHGSMHVVRFLAAFRNNILLAALLFAASCRWALQGSQRVQGSKLMRSVEAYEAACGFIDASNVNKWRLLHLNAPAVELLGGLGSEGASVWWIG